MDDYLITWSIDLAADDPVDAARQALEALTRDDSIAHVFVVQRHGEREEHIVDLDEIDGRV